MSSKFVENCRILSKGIIIFPVINMESGESRIIPFKENKCLLFALTYEFVCLLASLSRL